MRLYDAHNHLQDPWLDVVREDVLAHPPYTAAVVNGTQEEDWAAVSALAQRSPALFPAYGMHPWYSAGRSPQWLEHLRERLAAEPNASVGEIGLDRWKPDIPSIEEQREMFVAQWRLAVELGRPATVHCLRAWGPLADVLRAEPRNPRGFLLHAYGGSAEMAREFAGMGAYFSFPPSFLGERGRAKREVFAQLPPDRLLVETDAPALPPPPELTRWRETDPETGATINHPGNLVLAFACLADLRGWPLQQTQQVVESNFRRLFVKQSDTTTRQKDVSD